ncbi:MAG: hypothetical protein Q9M26_01005 [Mariprofundales bacterium]|nr:hypothetical protein [Mariprofundales bacterium]
MRTRVAMKLPLALPGVQMDASWVVWPLPRALLCHPLRCQPLSVSHRPMEMTKILPQPQPKRRPFFRVPQRLLALFGLRLLLPSRRFSLRLSLQCPRNNR